MVAQAKRPNSSQSPVAKWGAKDKPLQFGETQVPCYVLDDGRRVLTMNGIMNVLSISKKGSRVAGDLNNQISCYFASKTLKTLVNEDVASGLKNPILFRYPKTGTTSYGFEANLLVDLCDIIMQARDDGRLGPNQLHIAVNAGAVIRACAKVGIVALVDEATGYQEHRGNNALQKILDLYLSPVQSDWAKRFPDEFYQEIFRLRGWKWNGRSKNCPQCVAGYTRDLIYERLAPAILDDLDKINPVTSRMGRCAAHHQFLTPDVGHPALDSHIKSVVILMRATDCWERFMKMMNTALPKRPHKMTPSLFS